MTFFDFIFIYTDPRTYSRQLVSWKHNVPTNSETTSWGRKKHNVRMHLYVMDWAGEHGSLISLNIKTFILIPLIFSKVQRITKFFSHVWSFPGLLLILWNIKIIFAVSSLLIFYSRPNALYYATIMCKRGKITNYSVYVDHSESAEVMRFCVFLTSYLPGNTLWG